MDALLAACQQKIQQDFQTASERVRTNEAVQGLLFSEKPAPQQNNWHANGLPTTHHAIHGFQHPTLWLPTESTAAQLLHQQQTPNSMSTIGQDWLLGAMSLVDMKSRPRVSHAASQTAGVKSAQQKHKEDEKPIMADTERENRRKLKPAPLIASNAGTRRITRASQNKITKAKEGNTTTSGELKKPPCQSPVKKPPPPPVASETIVAQQRLRVKSEATAATTSCKNRCAWRGSWETLACREDLATRDESGAIVIHLLRGGRIRVWTNLIGPQRLAALQQEMRERVRYRQYKVQTCDEPRVHALYHHKAAYRGGVLDPALVCEPAEASEDLLQDLLQDNDWEMPGYRYAALTMKARPVSEVPEIQQLADDLMKTCQVENWGVGINPVCYRDGLDRIGLHSDDDQGEEKIMTVMIDSPPETRRVLIQTKKHLSEQSDGIPDEQIQLVLRPGDAYEMDNTMQTSYLHGVPKDTKQVGEGNQRLVIVLRSGETQYFKKDLGRSVPNLVPRSQESSYVFGPVPGVEYGHEYKRADLLRLRGHSGIQRGISGNATFGCDAIIVSGKRLDDLEDDRFGFLLYAAEHRVGAGALIRSATMNQCVRVFRVRRKSASTNAPQFYRYDGLYEVVTFAEPKQLANNKTVLFVLRMRNWSPTAQANIDPPSLESYEEAIKIRQKREPRKLEEFSGLVLERSPLNMSFWNIQIPIVFLPCNYQLKVGTLQKRFPGTPLSDPRANPSTSEQQRSPFSNEDLRGLGQLTGSLLAGFAPKPKTSDQDYWILRHNPFHVDTSKKSKPMTKQANTSRQHKRKSAGSEPKNKRARAVDTKAPPRPICARKSSPRQSNSPKRTLRTRIKGSTPSSLHPETAVGPITNAVCMRREPKLAEAASSIHAQRQQDCSQQAVGLNDSNHNKPQRLLNSLDTLVRAVNLPVAFGLIMSSYRHLLWPVPWPVINQGQPATLNNRAMVSSDLQRSTGRTHQNCALIPATVARAYWGLNQHVARPITRDVLDRKHAPTTREPQQGHELSRRSKPCPANQRPIQENLDRGRLTGGGRSPVPQGQKRDDASRGIGQPPAAKPNEGKPSTGVWTTRATSQYLNRGSPVRVKQKPIPAKPRGAQATSVKPAKPVPIRRNDINKRTRKPGGGLRGKPAESTPAKPNEGKPATGVRTAIATSQYLGRGSPASVKQEPIPAERRGVQATSVKPAQPVPIRQINKLTRKPECGSRGEPAASKPTEGKPARGTRAKYLDSGSPASAKALIAAEPQRAQASRAKPVIIHPGDSLARLTSKGGRKCVIRTESRQEQAGCEMYVRRSKRIALSASPPSAQHGPRQPRTSGKPPRKRKICKVETEAREGNEGKPETKFMVEERQQNRAAKRSRHVREEREPSGISDSDDDLLPISEMVRLRIQHQQKLASTSKSDAQRMPKKGKTLQQHKEAATLAPSPVVRKKLAAVSCDATAVVRKPLPMRGTATETWSFLTLHEHEGVLSNHIFTTGRQFCVRAEGRFRQFVCKHCGHSRQFSSPESFCKSIHQLKDHLIKQCPKRPADILRKIRESMGLKQAPAPKQHLLTFSRSVWDRTAKDQNSVGSRPAGGVVSVKKRKRKPIDIFPGLVKF